jgi:protein-S-isoprenylcysteine O-methyltransferase Ste14
MTSMAAANLVWDAWIVSWILAAVWSRRTAARPPAIDQLIHWVPTAIGFGLLFAGSRFTHFAPLWRLSPAAGWVLTGVCVAGLFFTWWARIALGSLWSGSVGRKEGHTLVRVGPYRLVRHPIYTGLILAALASAAQIGMAANLAGAVVLTFGLWLKARLEERFLSAQLGAEAYAEYRRGTPMLVPFWPAGGGKRAA